MSGTPGLDTLGRCFIDGQGVIWEQIAYTDRPTVSFRRVVDPSQRVSMVVGSRLAQTFELLSESEECYFRRGVEESADA